MKKRIEYFDVAKALLIALVVIGHELQYANPAYDIIPYTLAQEFIGSFYMPAFFVISGLLFDPKSLAERSWGEFGLRRIRTLVIPYFFFEMLAIVYKSLVLRSVSIVEGLRLMVTFRCNVGADWFLPAMFMADIIFFALVKYLHNKYVFAAAAVLCFAATPFLPAWAGVHSHRLPSQKIHVRIHISESGCCLPFDRGIECRMLQVRMGQRFLRLCAGQPAAVCAERDMRYIFCAVARITYPRQTVYADRRKFVDHYGYASARALHGAGEVGYSVDRLRVCPDRGSRSSTYFRNQQVLSVADRKNRKGSFT